MRRPRRSRSAYSAGRGATAGASAGGDGVGGCSGTSRSTGERRLGVRNESNDGMVGAVGDSSSAGSGSGRRSGKGRLLPSAFGDPAERARLVRGSGTINRIAAIIPGPTPGTAASSRRVSIARSSTLVTPARVSAAIARPGNPRSWIVRVDTFPGDLFGIGPTLSPSLHRGTSSRERNPQPGRDRAASRLDQSLVVGLQQGLDPVLHLHVPVEIAE